MGSLPRRVDRKPASTTDNLTPRQQRKEWLKCRSSAHYFITNYIHIKNERTKQWEPFKMWPAQRGALTAIVAALIVAILKARQVGLTWLVLAYILWLMTFHGGTYLLFSVGMRESKNLIKRLRGMHERLPPFLKHPDDDWLTTSGQLATGGEVVSLPASSGDSFTASGVFIDEADLIRNLPELEERAEPTINDGGWIIYNSRSNPDEPDSLFKTIYTEARAKEDAGTSTRHDPKPVFIPWSGRPDRDDAWYERQCTKALSKYQTLDSVHANYPSTEAEALSGRTEGKRLPVTYLAKVHRKSAPIPARDLPPDVAALVLAGQLRVYAAPDPRCTYVAGGDPAEGLSGPSHDDSACVWVDYVTGEEVAVLQGRLEPTEDFPAATATVCRWYGRAAVLGERNNHGHAYLKGLRSKGVRVLSGPDGRPGFPKSPASKAQVWTDVWGEVVARAEDTMQALEQGQDPPPPLIRDIVTYTQAKSLKADTCKAPTGKHDDVADAWSLAQVARQAPKTGRDPGQMRSMLGRGRY